MSSKKCFIVCPIGNDGSDTRKRSDSLLKHIITPVCTSLGFEVIRVDQVNATDSINQTILDCLNTYDLVIADLSEHNPNAFFELGYRTALQKPIIQLKSKEYSLPFDVASIRTLDYDLTDLDQVEQVKERLKSTITTIDFDSKADRSTPAETQQNLDLINSQILSELFTIQDTLNDITNKLDNPTNSAIEVLTNKLIQTNQQEPIETSILKSMLPLLSTNPKAFKELLEIGNQYNKRNSK